MEIILLKIDLFQSASPTIIVEMFVSKAQLDYLCFYRLCLGTIIT